MATAKTLALVRHACADSSYKHALIDGEWIAASDKRFLELQPGKRRIACVVRRGRARGRQPCRGGSPQGVRVGAQQLDQRRHPSGSIKPDRGAELATAQSMAIPAQYATARTAPASAPRQGVAISFRRFAAPDSDSNGAGMPGVLTAAAFVRQGRSLLHRANRTSG
jgi:hypothetical protein